MRRGLILGRVAGIEVVADVSLVALGALLVGSLFVDLRRFDPTQSPERVLVVAAAGGIVFLGGVLGHELAHSLVARRRDLTVRRIRLFIFGGVSEIEREASRPRDELWVALAGPAASFAIGIFLWLVSITLPESVALVARMLRVLAVVNVLLAAFNLLPGFPLDGGRALRAVLWTRGERARATRRAIEVGRVLALVTVGVGAWLLLRSRGLSGLWTVAVGWFLYRAANGAAERELLLERIAGVTVRDVMRPLSESAAGEISVARLIELHQMGPKLTTLPVVVDGRVRGLVGEREVTAVPEALRAGILVRDVMTPVRRADVVPASDKLETFLARDGPPAGRALVVAHGRVVGLVTGQELAHLFG